MDGGRCARPGSRRRWLATAAAVGFILFFISLVITADRANGTPWWSFIEEIPYGDKWGHLGLTGMLSFLCNLAFPGRKLRVVTVATLVLLVLVSLEELSQAFVPSRTLDLFDWLADLAGLTMGQYFGLKARLRLGTRQPRDDRGPG